MPQKLATVLLRKHVEKRVFKGGEEAFFVDVDDALRVLAF
jgi:hypothetical protein